MDHWPSFTLVPLATRVRRWAGVAAQGMGWGVNMTEVDGGGALRQVWKVTVY